MINRVKGYRAMLNKTQKDMAKLLDIAPQLYSNKETGKIKFNDNEKVILRDYFKQYFSEVETVDFLFFNQNKTKKDDVKRGVKYADKD